MNPRRGGCSAWRDSWLFPPSSRERRRRFAPFLIHLQSSSLPGSAELCRFGPRAWSVGGIGAAGAFARIGVHAAPRRSGRRPISEAMLFSFTKITTGKFRRCEISAYDESRNGVSACSFLACIMSPRVFATESCHGNTVSAVLCRKCCIVSAVLPYSGHVHLVCCWSAEWQGAPASF